MRHLQLAAKRSIDIAVSLTLMIVLSPLAAFAALAIVLTMGRPVLFRQVRPGYRGKPITVVKFRTMTTAQDAAFGVESESKRITRLGRLLRRTSLDELPQLWSVLNGDMSLVGPRPLLMEYLPLYTADQMRRHEVKPGITGLAQVSGRNHLPWEQRFELDVWYVDNWSLCLDLRILALTAKNVVQGEGVLAKGRAIMPSYTGDKVRDE